MLRCLQVAVCNVVHNAVNRRTPQSKHLLTKTPLFPLCGLRCQFDTVTV